MKPIVDLGFAANPLEPLYEMFESGRAADVEAECRGLLASEPENTDALNLLALALQKQNRTDEAIACAAAAISKRPDDARYHNNLGNMLQDAGRHSDALLCYEQALRLAPGSAPVHGNAANAHTELGRFGDAVSHYLAALEADPYHCETHVNLARALCRQGLTADAVGCYKEALRLNPAYQPARDGYADVLGQLATELCDAGKYEGAITCAREALGWAPSRPDLHLCLGRCLLTLGDLAAGWPEMEWRWRRKGAPPIAFKKPLWDGKALDGRTILIWAEQGAGDTIQYLRYAELLRQVAGARVVLECQPWVAALARSNKFIDQVAPYGETLPDFDVHAPLQSLPWILNTTLDTLPANVPYVAADPDAVERWAQRLNELLAGHTGEPRVGLVWAGSPMNPYDARRSMPFAALEPFAAVENVAWVSLQKGAPAFEIYSPSKLQVADLSGELGDFADMAAVVANLDLVITVDTSAAHLAGALGRPVWTMLPYVADCRWMTGRDDSPWYPTMRLFRQTSAGDWGSVVAQIVDELRRRPERPPQPEGPPHDADPDVSDPAGGGPTV